MFNLSKTGAELGSQSAKSCDLSFFLVCPTFFLLYFWPTRCRYKGNFKKNNVRKRVLERVVTLEWTQISGFSGSSLRIPISCLATTA